MVAFSLRDTYFLSGLCYLTAVGGDVLTTLCAGIKSSPMEHSVLECFIGTLMRCLGDFGFLEFALFTGICGWCIGFSPKVGLMSGPAYLKLSSSPVTPNYLEAAIARVLPNFSKWVTVNWTIFWSSMYLDLVTFFSSYP